MRIASKTPPTSCPPATDRRKRSLKEALFGWLTHWKAKAHSGKKHTETTRGAVVGKQGIRNTSPDIQPAQPDESPTIHRLHYGAPTSRQGRPKQLKTLPVASCAGITDFSALPPDVNYVALPQTATIKATTRSDTSSTPRTLAQKVGSYNADPTTNLVVSLFDPNKVQKFSLDVFQEKFETRRKAFDNNERSQVNFSGSLLTPTSRAKLFWHMPSRINVRFAHQYSYWKNIGLPENITQQQQDHLDLLQAHLDALREKHPGKDDLPNIRVAERALRQAWLAVWEGHPEVLYRCPDLYMGFIVSDHARIQHAFPVAGNTDNQRYTTQLHRFDTSPLKIGASRGAGPEKVKRDKHFKQGKNGIEERDWDKTLAALRKHTEKHNPTQCTEVLFGAPDDNLDHVIDGFFLDMRSGFEAMNLATVNLYLYHNKDVVLKNIKAIRDYPLLVNYTDKDSGRHKFAYITLTPEGIPVATEQLPV